MANKIKKSGIKLELISISPAQVDHEEFVYITQCYNCYKYDHPSYKCTRGRLEQCSECGMQGHTFRQCTSTVKKCLNCAGPHRTLANACRVRRDAIAAQRREQRERTAIKANKPLHEVARLAVQHVTGGPSSWRDAAKSFSTFLTVRLVVCLKIHAGCKFDSHTRYNHVTAARN